MNPPPLDTPVLIAMALAVAIGLVVTIARGSLSSFIMIVGLALYGIGLFRQSFDLSGAAGHGYRGVGLTIGACGVWIEARARGDDRLRGYLTIGAAVLMLMALLRFARLLLA